MNSVKVVIIGAKNPETGRMIKAITEAEARLRPGRGFQHIFHGFIDNDPERQGKIFCDLPVFGGFDMLDDLIRQECVFVNTITGSTRIRYETTKAVRDRGGRFVNFIHPTAGKPDHMGVGNYIQEQVLIQAGVAIGDNTSIHMGAAIGHETRIGDSVFIAHCVSVSGEVVIGDGAFIGTNATIAPRVAIGAWAKVGAGAVVFKDVPPHVVVIGNPAETLRVKPSYDTDGALNLVGFQPD